MPVDSNEFPEEFDGSGKRLWMEVSNITNELYGKHYKPTEYNTDFAILPTSDYVPPYLSEPMRK